MKMRGFLTGAVVLGLTAMPGMPVMPVMAGVAVTPMQGTMGNPFNTGLVSGFGWNAAAGGGAGPLIGNLYDNILTINGGAATAGCFGAFGCDIPATQAFMDWTNTQAQWGDDLHGISAGGTGPAVVTRLRYGYANTVATSTHIIKIYDMVPPSVVPSVTSVIQKGILLASITVVGNPTGAFLVTVTALNIQLPQTAVWIKFEEVGQGFPGTFWLTGGAGNGVGFSHPGLVYSAGTTNIWLPYDFFYVPLTGYVASNIQVALSGFNIPAPAVMSLLGVAGLVTLRRRRDRHR